MNLTWDQARALGIDVESLLTSNPSPAALPRVPGEPSLHRAERGDGLRAERWWLVEINEWRPATDNELHKSVKQEIKLKHRDQRVLRDMLMGNCGCEVAKSRRRVYLTVLKRRCPLPDAANLNKSFLDALVQIGALKNDSVEWVRASQPIVRKVPDLDVPVRSVVHLREMPSLCKCCARAEEYNGFGSDGPLLFHCPRGCSCHD